jgi:tRNA pseudouridine32 synthase/23S rRNA pseudouridine746 synthase
VAAPAVLHLDAALLGVDKPPGRLVIPGRAGGEPSLREELEALHGRLWVVHRLDRGTSGVLLFARTAEAHRAVNLQFERGRPEKVYLALVAGLPGEEAFRVELALAPARRGRMRPARPGEAGKPAATAFRVVERFPAVDGRPAATLLEARPVTGRTHQLRVHLAAAGHPLLVDADYGAAAALRGPAGPVLARTPLHAARLTLEHPAGGRLTLEAPLPPDLQAALRLLRGPVSRPVG